MRRGDPEQRREVVARGPGCWGSGLRAQWVGSTPGREVVRRGGDKEELVKSLVVVAGQFPLPF